MKWDEVDWTLSDRRIARMTGFTEYVVSKRRATHESSPRASWDVPFEDHEVAQAWVAYSTAVNGMSQLEIALAMDCTIQEVDRIERRALAKLAAFAHEDYSYTLR